MAQDAGDERGLAEADFAVSQALARVVLDELETNRRRSRELEVEALELRAESRILLQMGMGPERGVGFVRLAVRASEWAERWRLFAAELQALGSNLQ